MLEGEGIDYQYREYRKEPLSEEEIRSVLKKLKLEPAEVFRPRDRAAQELGLTGKEDREELIHHMAQHPTLLQRPIGIVGKRAVVGRPPERLLELFG